MRLQAAIGTQSTPAGEPEESRHHVFSAGGDSAVSHSVRHCTDPVCLRMGRAGEDWRRLPRIILKVCGAGHLQ